MKHENSFLRTAVMVVAMTVLSWSTGVRCAVAQTFRQTSTAVSAASPYWPGWLGPKRNGWVSGFRPPTRWPGQLKKVWQVKVGIGYGSPLVAADRVYQHTRQGEAEVLWCLDLKTGEARWRKSYPAPFKIRGGGEYHGKGPKSSPVMADGRIFTMSIAGVLTAWDAVSGKQLWRRDYDAQFKRSHPHWGASTSPIVDGNQLIVHFGIDERGALVALDTATGKQIWSQGKDGPSYTSPLLVEIHGVRQVVEWNHRALVGVDSRSGKFLWEFPFPHVGSDQNMPTPTYHNGRVLLGGENRGIHSLEPQLDNGVWTVKQRWHQKKVALDMSSAVINGNLLYGFSHYGKGRIFCLDTTTGKVLWQGPGRTGANAMLLSIPGHVVALINNGGLKVIKANAARFEMAASYRVAENGTWAPPVLLERAVLVKDVRTLTLWSLPDSTASSR
ncbi:MAG: PQQ-binding-like beta-propeller repeat protein [Planctomycetaceae bacterium]